ncbi:hypothetical protein NPIL_212651 [Nephila pilipes]|uniref:Uncharacterized protein n=1 Tax=Nephila pilipes TaxID=299642 RepID=A0A8X6P7E4_NEPPI|nr:hypothetical protein NPIL_212651 [Nephila pilipes]
MLSVKPPYHSEVGGLKCHLIFSMAHSAVISCQYSELNILDVPKKNLPLSVFITEQRPLRAKYLLKACMEVSVYREVTNSNC